MTPYIIVFLLGVFVGVLVGNKNLRVKLFKEVKKTAQKKGK